MILAVCVPYLVFILFLDISCTSVIASSCVSLWIGHFSVAFESARDVSWYHDLVYCRGGLCIALVYSG